MVGGQKFKRESAKGVESPKTENVLKSSRVQVLFEIVWTLVSIIYLFVFLWFHLISYDYPDFVGFVLKDYSKMATTFIGFPIIRISKYICTFSYRFDCNLPI